MKQHTLAAVLLILSLPLGVGVAAQEQPAPPDVAAPPADAVKELSGLASKVITAGKGDRKATATDQVTVHYTGWTTNGSLFDSSRPLGKPAVFSLGGVIPGFRDCVALMTIGETRRCWIPQGLAYRGQPGRPPGMLVFEIELIAAAPSPTIAPPDVAKPPSDANRTASGLFYTVLKAGDGSQRPFSDSSVTVHYTGWTTDGKMFDSSVARNMPATFRLNEVIKGWTEGVQLMVEGEKRRFWIPESLAYAQGGGPRGILVFDIELIRIER